MNLFAVSGLLLGITCLFLMIFLLTYGNTRIHYIWMLFNLSVSIWGFGCFIAGRANAESVALFGWRFAHIGGLFVSVFFYHMTCVFCNLKRRKSIIAAYLIGFSSIFIVIMTNKFINKTRFIFKLYYNEATLLYSLILILWLILVAVSFFDLLRYYPITKGIKRVQTRYLIVGFLTGFIGGISTFLPEFKIDIIYPIGNFTIPIYCFISTYAILRYRLMDINIAIKKTAIYSLSAGLLSGFFVVFVLVMTRLISDFTAVSSFKISLLAAVMIALMFDPLRNRIQKIIDKVFYKKTYDYYGTIQKVSHELASMFDVRNIYQFVGDTILSTLNLRTFCLMAAITGGEFSTVYVQSAGKDRGEKKDSEWEDSVKIKKINKDSEVITFFKGSEEMVIKDELTAQKERLGEEKVNRFTDDLKQFKGEAVKPVLID
ncbi:MAG: histidine kinase N-terminal 7TM domain-containing protein, partial [Candidatus Thorarchaeota archaeon]